MKHSIGQLGRLTGVTASALRFYELAGVLPKPSRQSGHRLYDHNDVRRVNVLRFAQLAGFSLAEIKLLFSGFCENATLAAGWRRLATRKLQEFAVLQQNIDRMRSALERAQRCGCARVEDCLLSPADVFKPASSREAQGCCRPSRVSRRRRS